MQSTFGTLRFTAAAASLLTVAGVLAAGLQTTAGATTVSPTVEAERLTLTPGAGAIQQDSSASAGASVLIWSNGSVSGWTSAPRAGAVIVRARAQECGGWPRLRVDVNGAAVATVDVDSWNWKTFRLPGAWAEGGRSVRVSFVNDFMGWGCDRNVFVDSLRFEPVVTSTPTPTPTSTPTGTATATPTTTTAPTATTAPATSTNPLAGAPFYVLPDSPAKREADARRSWAPDQARLLDKIGNSAAARWYGGWVTTDRLAAEVAAHTRAATAAKSTSLLVAYNIPFRDCGLYSAGGAANGDAYLAWIRQFAAGIGTARVAVIVEPDALAGLDCLSEDRRTERLRLLSQAVDILAANANTAVYLDAGHSQWKPADVIASRLTAANVARARGFALNVSNYLTTAESVTYGKAVSSRIKGKTFLVDTSRNGLGPYSGPALSESWCNPPGRALGPRPTTATGDRAVDAYVWVKMPGESDGECGRGNPPAGHWWTDYALGLASRAAY